MRHRFVFTIARPSRLVLVLGAALCLVAGSPAAAQDPDSARITELERRIEAVTRELERMQLGADVVEADTAIGGLPFGASKVYQVQRGVSIGGYGEIVYENFATEREDGARSGATDKFDALRGILYVGYKFNDRVLFNSEIEIEHATEAFLEFAYVDYQITDNVGLRGGLLLAPMGLVNELHEPTYFLGSKRSITETRIIPTTWRENGLGLFGEAGPLEWRAYVLNSFDGGSFNGTGLRGGRQKGGEALAEDFGVLGRVDYVGKPGLRAGVSAYAGQTAQNRELDGEAVGGEVVIWDVHADYRVQGWVLRGLVAGAQVSDVAELNELNGLTGTDGIGSEMLGWYGEVGYDILRGFETTHELLPYVRYERVNTQREVAAGFGANPANDVTAFSAGIAWKPVPQVVWKLDWSDVSNQANTGVDQLNMQIGWLF
jgi:hypothetical protein